ncbi:hypothetical protein [Alkalimonas sp.]|uniref:hypothetical protein n=1 Tax=Alkalimonas sp. TaxID=1872453 RepID=UPI00263AC67D|nr:hypothetical protein [Alkalimonas sp.]MCC5827497.1 hypothetical protein [Alkalimonas sp.]
MIKRILAVWSYFKRVVSWLCKAWPLIIIISVISFHYLIFQTFDLDEHFLNKLIIFILQVFGGCLILFSIDSNLSHFKDFGLKQAFSQWMKAFPKFKQVHKLTLAEGKYDISMPMFGVGISVRNDSFKTTKEHLEYLQKQIDEIRQQQTQSMANVESHILDMKSELFAESNLVKSDVKSLTQSIEELTLSGIKSQILGVFLLVYSAFLGVFI